jgi:hypothetical protein
MAKSKIKLPQRVDKTLQWLEGSRDSWKEKTIESKYELQKQKIAVKRARKSRDVIREELVKEQAAHYEIQNRLNKKESEIAELKMQLEQAKQQVEEFKKKQLLR